MKTNAVVLKFVFPVLQLAAVAILFISYLGFVFWVDENYSPQNSDFALIATMGLTLIPLIFLALVFYSWVKGRWETDKTGVMVLGIFLFLGGILGTHTLMRLNTLLKYGHESSAIQALREIYRAQADFKMKYNRHATLQELIDTTYLHPSYAGEYKPRGYKLSVTDVSATTFCIHADRIKPGSGTRDFSLSETGDIRFINTRLKGTVARGQGELLYNLSEQ